MAKKVRTLPRIPRTPSGSESQSSATIAVYSVKGGVGKTTLSANLAWCSAHLAGHRSLLWDLDATGGAGFLYGVDARKSKPVDAVFAQSRDPLKQVLHTDYEGLDILPADESIRHLNEQLSQLGKRRRLAKLVSRLGDEYSRIILDCPPVMNEISAQVIRAADLVIVPLPPSPLSNRAFDLVVQEIKAQGKGHPPILPVLSMLDLRRTLHRQAREANPDWPVIPYASVVEQGAVRQRPVGAFAPGSPAAKCFAGLWEAIERKLSRDGKA